MAAAGKGPAGSGDAEHRWGPRGVPGEIHVALVFPNTYEAGMSSLGFLKVYQLFDHLDGITCERVFLPRSGPEKPPPRSEETGRPLTGFDLIAVTVSFENDAVHLIDLLKRSRIPPRRQNRSSHHPMILAGGVACFLNPEPLAPFVDCFLLGEIEETLASFIQRIRPGRPLKARLSPELARDIPGVYIPAYYTPRYDNQGRFNGHDRINDQVPLPVAVPYVQDLASHPTYSTFLTDRTTFKQTCLIETGRGCHHGCRFCSAGFIYRPPRTYPADTVMATMEKAACHTGRVGLVSAAVSDHPRITDICTAGTDQGLRLSFSSFRLDALAPELIAALASSGVKTATIAPEAGTGRMQAIINKKISEQQILSAAARLVEGGILHLKLYFMIGLPFETDGDVQGIIDLTERIRTVFVDASRKQKKIGTITLSVNPFVPKPVTPFQWMPMAPTRTLKKRAARITTAVRKMPNVRVQHESHRMARVNALLARGDQRMADAMEAAVEKGWSALIRECPLPLTLDHPLDPEAPLPWDILESRVRKTFLQKELDRARAEKTSPDCPMIDCSRCGICR